MFNVALSAPRCECTVLEVISIESRLFVSDVINFY